VEVAAKASACLAEAGIQVVVVGGSAITVHAPEVYTSHDIDFAAINGTDRRAFGKALAQLGFRLEGRDYVHPDSSFSLDLVADTPLIDQRQVSKFATVETRFGPVRVFKFEDAIADRIAAFLHWGDSESLYIAERVVQARAKSTKWKDLESALSQLDTGDPEASRRLRLASVRLRSAVASSRAKK
jgi:hypothetical protein